MTNEVTPSEYQRMSTSSKQSSNSKSSMNIGIMIVVAVVLCGVSFAAGMSYQKSHTKTPTAFGQGANGSGGPGDFGNGQRPNIGEVKSVSADSITVSNTRSGSDQTYKITSSTTVTNDGQTASISDIKTGDTVVVQTDSSDTSTATRIMLNPSFQGPPQSSSSSQDSMTN